MDRAGLAALLDDEATLDDWIVYPEPPEQLVGAQSIVVSPRSPYQTPATISTLAHHLAVSLLVPRTTPAPMDLIDAGLAILRPVLVDAGDIEIEGETSVGIVDDVGGSSYIIASVNITVH